MNPTKHETHIEGIEYARDYLAGRNIDTIVCKDGRRTYLRIVDDKLDGKIITVGAMQEHESYLMSKVPGDVKYDYNIVITGLRYNIKRVFLMTDKDARILANNASHGTEKDGRITQEQLLPYRNSELE